MDARSLPAGMLWVGHRPQNRVEGDSILAKRVLYLVCTIKLLPMQSERGMLKMSKLIWEAILYSLLYTAFMLVLFKVQGVRKQLYNYPPAIKQRAIERGITTQAEMDAMAKKNKIFGLLVMAVLSMAFTCGVNKQFTFGAGFAQSYLFFNVFSLFDALVIDSIWFCHSKWWVVPGTEDMTDAYHDYAFHWKWFFVGLVSSLPLSAIIGGLVALIGLL